MIGRMSLRGGFLLLLLVVVLVAEGDFCYATALKPGKGPTKISNPSSPKATFAVLDLSRLLNYEQAHSVVKNLVNFERAGVMTSKYEVSKAFETRFGPGQAKGIEAKLISEEGGTVKRKGKVLTIETQTESPFVFTDYWYPATKYGEGGEEKCIYAGRIGNTGYHIVEVFYMHDSPWLFFIHPEVRSIVSVNEEHTIYFNNGNMLVLNNSPTPPYGLAVAQLSSISKNIHLICLSHPRREPTRYAASEGWDMEMYSKFEGWRVSGGFGFKLLMRIPEQDLAKASIRSIPVEIFLEGGKWHILVPEADLEFLSDRLSCWQQ